MSYEVKFAENGDLDEDGEVFNSPNEWGDYRTLLFLKRNGAIISQHSDGGEPEDNTFGRDWRWVAGALRQAYEFGLEDGKAAPK